jgi:hypothetical protein
MMAEIRKTTSLAKIQRDIEDLKRLAEKRGLAPDKRPKITLLLDGPKRDQALAFLAGRHWAIDPKTNATLFTLRLDNRGPRDEPPDAA